MIIPRQTWPAFPAHRRLTRSRRGRYFHQLRMHAAPVIYHEGDGRGSDSRGP